MAELEKRLEDLSARVESRQALPPTPSDGGSPADPAESNSGGLPPAKKRRTWMSDAPPPAFGYIFGGEDGESQAVAPEDSASRHRSSHSPVLSQKTLGVATPVLWDDREKASRPPSSYHRHAVWTGGLPQIQDAAVPSGTQGGSKPGPEWPRGWPRGEEADRLLAEYREHMEPIFPFIVIPRHMNSEQLRKERPYLWKAAMMQTLCLDASRQVPLGNELLNDIVTASFLQPRRSFDLLQGLEILVAW